MKTASVLTAICLVLMAAGAALSVPYEVDSHTLHLYHFNGDALDSVTTNPIPLTLDSGATATDASLPGMGQALHTWEGTNRTGVLLPSALGPAVAVSNFTGADGALTFEALVCPAYGLGAMPNNMQIISGEHDSSRGWQFRVESAGNLTFINLTGTVQTIATPLPAMGPHAFAANKWYHAAVTYNGQAGAAGNLKLYWTALDSGAAEAVELGSFTMNADVAATATPFFVIGNEGRSGNGRTENWEGWIDEVRISDIARGPGEMIPQVMADQASSPTPANKATDVPRGTILSWQPADSAGTHDVYLGTSSADIDAADRTNPLGGLVRQGQDANSFDPGLLEFGRTYFWRVDEVNAVDASIAKGSIWSFTVEPYSYPIADVIATASSFTMGQGAEMTVNGSGLDADDQHSNTGKDVWLSNRTGSQPTWIQFEFDAVYKLDFVQVWNYNQLMEPSLGLGVKSATIEYSEDGAQWTVLGDVELAQASGLATYTPSTVDLGGIIAKYVKLAVKSNWGGLLPQYGLSEVRFFQVPVRARQPMPADGAAEAEIDGLLSWRPGREAVSHQVGFGTDPQAVAEGTAAVQTVGAGSFDPGVLNLGTTYYWKVVEINEAAVPSAWAGDVWSFTTREYLPVDDMESYNDDDSRIFDTWLDGYGDQSSGSIVGHLDAPFAERTIVHGGKQSMPFEYNNANQPFYSEASREFSPVQNWTVNGSDTLSLWARGNLPAYVDNAGTITMTAAGHDIWDNADDFRFAHRTLNGDGSALVKVESLVNTNGWAKAGVMIRQSLDADSKFVYFIVSPAQGVSMGWRQATAGGCGSATQASIAAPQWVKLVRTGDVFTAQYSADGTAWTDLKVADGAIASTTVAMTSPVYVGLCVTSHNPAATTTAVMSGAAVTGPVSGSWAVATIGDDPQPANDPADLYVTVQDSSGKSATATHPTAVTSGEWTQWQIPLSSLTGVNLKAIKKMYLGVGSKSSPTQGGSGMLYIDDIGFGHPAQ